MLCKNLLILKVAFFFRLLDKSSTSYLRLKDHKEDYIAKKVANEIVSGKADKGILVCGTGIGMSIAANKVKGIRAALCSDTFSARATRAHNNSNILCLGQRAIGECLALEIVDVWLHTEFEGGRHQRRIDEIE